MNKPVHNGRHDVDLQMSGYSGNAKVKSVQTRSGVEATVSIALRVDKKRTVG